VIFNSGFVEKMGSVQVRFPQIASFPTLSVAAEAELLTVSDICRRSVVEALKGLEEKHGLAAPKPSISTSNGLPSEWLKHV